MKKWIDTLRHFERWIVLAIFIGLAALFWCSSLRTGSEAVLGSGGDPFQTLWRFVRLTQALHQGSLVIPEERDLVNLGPLPWTPLLAVFDEVSAYNLVWFASAVLSGWCTYLLARTWGARPLPALLAGVLVQWSPYRLSQALGHFGSMQLWWIPAVLASASRWIATRRPGWGVMTALLIIGTAWTEHQLFLSLLLILLCFSIVFRRRLLDHVRVHRATTICCIVLVLAGAFGPFLPTLRHTASPDSFFNLGNEQRERFAASLATLFLPAPFHPVRDGVQGYVTDTGTVADHVHTLGIFLPLTALLLFVRGPRRRLDWALAITSCLGLLLALGPWIEIGSTRIPLPAAAFDILPIFSALRTVGRFIALPVLLLPVFVALRWQAVSRLRSIAPVLGLAFLIEFLPPFGFPVLALDRALARALTELPAGPVLVLPATTDYTRASEHLYYSALHGHPTVANVALERAMDPEERRMIVRTPVVGDLALLRPHDFRRSTFFGQEPVRVAPAAFEALGIRSVLLDTRHPAAFLTLEGTDVRPLDAREIETIRAFLQRLSGNVEHEIAPGVWWYPAPVVTDPGASVVAIRGNGWRLAKRDDSGLLAEVHSMADFSLYSPQTEEREYGLRVRTNIPARIQLLRPDGSTAEFGPITEPRVVSLGRPVAGLSSFRLVIDGPPVLIDTPEIFPLTE